MDNFVNFKVGWALTITSAWALLTSERLQQESIGRGRGIPAEVTRVQRMFLLARSRSEISRWLGTAVIAGWLKTAFAASFKISLEEGPLTPELGGSLDEGEAFNLSM